MHVFRNFVKRLVGRLLETKRFLLAQWAQSWTVTIILNQFLSPQKQFWVFSISVISFLCVHCYESSYRQISTTWNVTKPLGSSPSGVDLPCRSVKWDSKQGEMIVGCFLQLCVDGWFSWRYWTMKANVHQITILGSKIFVFNRPKLRSSSARTILNFLECII